MYEGEFCRFEKTLGEIMDISNSELFEDKYIITAQDLISALTNIKNSGNYSEDIDDWFWTIYDEINGYVNDQHEVDFENSPEDVETHRYLPDRNSFLIGIFYDVIEVMVNEDKSLCENADEVIGMIENFLENEKKPVFERDYTDEDKEYFIKSLGNSDMLSTADEKELDLYRKFIEELCAKDNTTALYYKGYGCYGGDVAYECNWDVSLECILKLYELTGEPMFANTLGYIYYYGRCNNGKPQYDEAFRYFSIGAAGGHFESRYKLADMFENGYGVVKNPKMSFGIVNELYNQNIEYIFNGQFDCKFADVAFRMGNYKEKGYNGVQDSMAAYFYYLQADFAIKRRLQYNRYGDLSVAERIRTAIDNLYSSDKVEKPEKTSDVCIAGMFEDYLSKYRKLQMTVRRLKNGDLKATVRIVPFKGEKYPPKMFITEYYTGFCGMLEKVNFRVKVDGYSDFGGCSTTFEFDYIDGYDFMIGDEIVFTIIGDYYFTNPEKESKKKYKFASVYFSAGGKHYDYLLDIDGISAGDKVIVMTDDRGETEVTVADILEKSESELALPLKKYKKILRKK